MNIDLTVLKEAGSHRSIKKKIDLPEFDFRNQRFETPFPFQLSLDIFSSKDSFIFSGTLKGKLVLTCSRCLSKFDYSLDLKLEEEVMKSEITTPANYDPVPLLIENILLAIPIKPICSAECRGLCPVCGQDLNEGDCGCEREIIDPRLAKLKEFFNDDAD